MVEHTTENRGVPGSSPGLAIHERPANELDLLADASFASAPRDPNWLVFIAECGETCALLGATNYAGELYDLLPIRRAQHHRRPSSRLRRSAHRVLGLLAAVTGQLDLAVDHLEAAAAANARMGLQPFVVRAQAQLVAVLHARGDHKRAAALAADANAARERLSIGPITEPQLPLAVRS